MARSASALPQRTARPLPGDGAVLRVPPVLVGLFTGLGLIAIGGGVFLLQQRESLRLMLGALGAILLILIVIRPVIGLAAVVATATVLRVTVGTGTASVIVASLGCAALLGLGWALHRLLHRQPVQLLPRAISIPSFVLLGAIGFSWLWGRATVDPRIVFLPNFLTVQFGGAILVVASIGLLFVGADLLAIGQHRRWLAAALIVVGFAWLPLRFIGHGASILSTGGLFGVWFVALCWANALSNRALDPLVRCGLAGGALAWMALRFFWERDWVSGWLPPLVALLLVTLLAFPRVGIPISLVAAIVIYANPQWFASLLTQEEAQGSVGGDFGRFELALRSLDILRDHLILGTGPVGYAPYYLTLIPERAMSTHNNYVDILAEFGVAGLLALVALLIGLWWLGWRCRPQLTDQHDRAIAVAILGGIPAVAVAMALGDWVLPFVYNQTIAGFEHSVYTWLMFAALCGMIVEQRAAGQRQGGDLAP